MLQKRDLIFLKLWGSVLLGGTLGTPLQLGELYRDDLRYDEVTFLTSHNSFTIKTEGWIYYQQSLSFDNQMEYGVWSYMLDLHWCERTDGSRYVALAHVPEGSSNLHNYTETNNQKYLSGCWGSDAQRRGDAHLSFESFLRDYVKNWLANDSRRIITLHLESYLGTDGARQLKEIFDRTGVSHYIYPNRGRSGWPTLGDMRATRERLVLFSSNPGDCGSNQVFSTLNYRETEYDLKMFAQCERRFDERDVSNASTLLLLNHFYKTSFETKKLTYHQVNNPYADSMRHVYGNVCHPTLFARTRLCFLQEGIYPNFVAIDFVEEGDAGGAREWVLYLNDLREVRRKNMGLLLDFFPTGFVAQAGSNPRPVVGNPPVAGMGSLGHWLTVLVDPNFSGVLSAVLKMSSYRQPVLGYPAALLGAFFVGSWVEDWSGYHVPVVLSAGLNKLTFLVFYKVFLDYHPLQLFIWLSDRLAVPLVRARIQGRPMVKLRTN